MIENHQIHEVHFQLNGYLNKQNYLIWGHEKPQAIQEEPINCKKSLFGANFRPAAWFFSAIGRYLCGRYIMVLTKQCHLPHRARNNTIIALNIFQPHHLSFWWDWSRRSCNIRSIWSKRWYTNALKTIPVLKNKIRHVIFKLSQDLSQK